MIETFISSTDAAVWTDEFIARFGGKETPDWGTMIGWFSNAMVAQEQATRKKYDPETRQSYVRAGLDPDS